MRTDLSLDADRINAALSSSKIGGVVKVHEELGSTSDHIRQLGQAGHPHGTVVLAEHQTAGRGRRENTWTASPGKNILMSVLLRPSFRLDLWPRVTTLAALALCRVIETLPLKATSKPAIKWPNDLYLGDKKCAGILAETSNGAGGPFLVLGMGLNVNETAFPEDLKAAATSLRLERRADPDIDLPRNDLVIFILQEIHAHWPQLEHAFPMIVEEVRQRSWLLGKRISARTGDGWVEGVATDLNEEGYLLLREDSGHTVTLTSAELVRPVA